MERPRILIMGKLPPPVMGPAIATRIILDSNLNEQFELIHFDTRINETVADMGTLKWSKFANIRKKYKAFSRVLKESKPEVVLVPISQTTMGFFKDLPFIKMAAKSGAKVVLQLRGSAFKTWYDGLKKPIQKSVFKTMKRADGVIVLGENLKYIFEDFYPEDCIFVVPNGGDYRFPERNNDKLRLTYLANYLPGKGIYECLQALEILTSKAELPDFEFHAYGNWDSDTYEKSCREIADKPNMKHCFLHGAITGAEKWQALSDSDVFVFAPKLPEGHPWSIVEAIAAELPVVSTDRGAIVQSVIHEQNGYVLQDPNPDELAEKLFSLLSNSELRSTMSRASRVLYEKEFTANKMTEKLGRVFTQILKT